MKISAGILVSVLTLTSAAPFNPGHSGADDGAPFNGIINPRNRPLQRVGAEIPAGHDVPQARFHGHAKAMKRDPLAEAEAEADPFYPLKPGAPSAGKPPHGDLMSKFAHGYGFGHGPVVNPNPRPKVKVGRRNAAGPANWYGSHNSVGPKKGKLPSAEDLCDNRKMVCKKLKNKYNALESFRNN
ncbi:hypothetical protein HRR90_007919 [Exophiala dermatitidis]|uniref:Uncharacterized protein n=2 Tax=Exophiala dermatitidis TaxID=5970 RepID=H6C9S4_EXODN|nr:uncharacterized protein HMPREF1120_07903 [Exophiala dermatitidis NIH/UT8656]EHY59927.1 hypothetical protein HMPREF1120_07903 [Exophiala dermatitidis NIH/UT8656]KAJ4618106.1 hypothetical protein HRR86_007220 [Exophiala dermatitidis]KAJ4644280.1 hypothetical protein HRR90_007919 [Exophiala dermatitidis]